MSEENTNLVPEELAPAAPVVEPAPVVEEAPKAAKTKAPDPVAEEPAPAEPAVITRTTAAALEAVAAPGRGSIGVVPPETGLRVKL